MGFFHTNPGDYRWHPVVDAPLPHNPYKLPDLAQKSFEAASKDRTPIERMLDALSSEAVRQRRQRNRVLAWRDGLVGTDLREFRHLSVDWDTALQVAWDAVQTVRPWNPGTVSNALRRHPSGLEGAATALLLDPISWSPGSDHVADGQHRLLAMYLQGVECFLYALT